ncbi:signal peptide peptidase SppA [Salinarimonas ramus]|uniref:Clp protease n=1 Tax=Salinarimonas ramus TaxID=690164 RepID=A0A917QBI5_9HYPH|nr:signal peptide peptidase SppA [Salinarimonas ramus]GGK40701.1 Clp protease [Salinarimonas ramus]
MPETVPSPADAARPDRGRTDPEHVADRRRLRRKLGFWRVLGILAAVIAVIAVGWRIAGPDEIPAGRDHVARVSVSGMITTDREAAEMLRELAETETARGVIVRINSPGGTTTGAEELFTALREVARAKPTVAFVDGLAASGGYIAALGADHIVSRQTAIVGSIGVLIQVPNVSGLLDELGIEVVEIKSTPLKAAPSAVSPVDEDAVEAIRLVVSDTYQWFVELVGERRPLSVAEVERVSDGRVWNGRQALALGLVDALGDEETARAWLAEAGIDEDLPVRDWEPDRAEDPFDVFAAGALVADLAGLDGLSATLARASARARGFRLDGLLALWQPRLEN